MPGLALGQGGAPTLREAQDSAFPDRVYIYRTPERTALTNFQVTENGGAVDGLGVTSGTKSSGAILLIDASNSMRGAPIAGAMVAARAFLAQRKSDLPVAVIAYNPEITVLTDFTTDSEELAAAVAQEPATAEGTHIYDALIKAAELADELNLPRMTAVLLSDGHRRGVQASVTDALDALTAANVRVISVGLRSPEYDPLTLQNLAGLDSAEISGRERARVGDDGRRTEELDVDHCGFPLPRSCSSILRPGSRHLEPHPRGRGPPI